MIGFLRSSINRSSTEKPFSVKVFQPIFRCASILLMALLAQQVSAQQVDTWFMAGKGINSPTNGINLFLPNPITTLAQDGDPVTTWYDIVYYSEQNAVQHPNPVDYPNDPFGTPDGFDYPFPNSGGNPLFLTPMGSIPGVPTVRRNPTDNMNFNPIVNFDGSGTGQALHFRSNSRRDITVFIVFKARGAGNSAETQRLLFGGDVDVHHRSANSNDWTTNLSLGVADGNTFSIGRTWNPLNMLDPGEFYVSGGIDLLGEPSIGTFNRLVGVNAELLITHVNGIQDIVINRNHPLADNTLFYFNRLGKHFNSNDSNRNLTGDIAEVLLADFSLSNNLRERVQSYLAIKYGITLNAVGSLGSINGNTSFNYLAADGTVIWTVDPNYRHDIAGLGKDRYKDVSKALSLRYNIDQRISKSVNSDAIVTMSTNTDFSTDNLDLTRTEIDGQITGQPNGTPNDHNYLMWGNDNQSINSSALELPPGLGITSRIQREWRIQAVRTPGVNPIQGVSVRVDLSGSDILTNSGTCAIKLLIDTDGNGDFTDGPITVIEATLVDGFGNAYFDGVDFQHLDVFTIGFGDTTNPTASNPATTTVCDTPPLVDPSIVNDETDNCAVDSVTFQGEVSDGNTNPETITRTYRVTDTAGNFIDVTHTILVYTTPVIANQPDIVGCAPQVFPTIDGIGLISAAYYDAPNGGGNSYNPGDPIPSSGTYYIYDETASTPNCSAETSFNVTLTPPPTASAGPDDTICGSVNYTLTGAMANNFDNLLWTHNGSGNFTDATALNAIYEPSLLDVGSTVTLTLTASSTNCPDAIDSIDLTITLLPFVDAGSDEEICEGATLDLAASGTTPSASNTSSLSWATAGDGSFDDATALLPIYTPGINDIANGSVVLTLTGNGNGSCPATLDAMKLTITPAPIVDAGSDEEICEGATLDLAASGTPPIDSNTSSLSWATAGDGSFDDATALMPVYTPGANDIANGSVILTLTGNGNGSCPATLDAMTLTVTSLPIADAPADVESCDSYILPALANGNYFDAPNGGGNAYAANDVITATTTLYVFSPGIGSCPDVENSFTVTINNTPLADAPADVESCDSYVLPALANGNYFDAPNGGGNAYVANDVITATTTLYVFSPGNGSCPDVENSFTVTINNTPLADAPADVESCDSYILPALANGNYFDAPNGGGNAYAANDVITATTTLYVFSPGTGSCPDVENSFTVTINITPDVFALADVEACDSFVLPAINGNNLSGNQAYYDGPGGTGTQYSPMDVIATSGTYYIYDETGTTPNCFDQESFVITITPSPTVDAGSDEEICEGATLDLAASGTTPIASNTSSLSWTTAGDGSFDDPTALLPVYTPGVSDIANGSVVLTLTGNGNGSCPATLDAMTLTITPAPIVDAGSDEEVCQGATLDLAASGTTPIASNTSSLSWTTAGDGSFDDPTALLPVYTPGVSDIANGSVVLTLTGNGNGSCPLLFDAMALTINSIPFIGVDVYSDPTTCGGSDGSISLIFGNVPDGVYDIFHDAGVFNAVPVNAGSAIVNGLPEGNYNNLRITVAGCTSTDDPDVTLTAPAAPVIDPMPDVSACDQYILPAITGTDLTGSQAYYDMPGGGGNQYNPLTIFNIVGTTTLYIYDQNGTCSDEVSFTVTINNTPAIDPLADQTACDAYTLPAITGSDLSGNEAYFTGTGGTGTQYAAGQAVGAGTYYIYDETGTTPNCSDEVSFTVTINITPDVFALADVEACDSFVLPAINGNNLSGNQAYYDGPGGTGTQYSPMDVIATSGTYYIYDETGTTPNCFDQESFVITITPSPTVDAGSDEEICEGATLDLAASGTTPIASNTSSLSWTTAGDGSFDDPTALLPVYTPGVSDIANGSVVLTLTGNGNGSCPLVFDAMTLTITPAPIVDAGSDEEICEGATLDLAASGTTPIDSNTSSLTWATAGDGSFDDATALLPVYTPGANDIANGLVVLTLTGNGNGSCPATLDAMTLTITPAPIVDAGSDEEVCQGATLDLAASGTTPIASNTSSLTWATAGDGSFDDATALLPVYTPGVSDIANGSVVLTLTGNGNGSCPATLDAMTLTITPLPIADAPTDVESCDSYVLPALTNGNYFDAPNGGGNAYAANDVITATTTLYVFSPGTGSCSDVENSFTVTINNTPAIDPLADQTACDAYTLPAITGSDLSGNEAYFTGTGGTGTQYAAGQAVGAGTYYIYDETGTTPNCSDEVSFTVTINITPDVFALADVEACDSFVLPAINGNNLSGNQAYYDGPGGTGTQYSPMDVIATSGTYYIYDETGTTPNCFDQESFVITITPSPTVDAGSDEEICEGATLDLAASGTTPIASNTSSLSWTTAGDGSFDDPTALLPVYTPGVSDIANGSVVLTLTGNGNGSCPLVFDAMTLTITPAPIVDAGSDEEICEGATLDLAASGTTPIDSNTSSLTWATAGDGSFDDATALLPVYTPGANDIANGLVVLTLTGNGNGSCPAMLDSMTLTITPLPIADAPTDVESCDSYVLPALANGNYFDAPNGGGNAYAANDVITATTTLYVFSPGTGSCPDVENSFTVTINNTPAIDPLADQTACDAYTLPAITGSDLSGNEAYFTGTGGTGTQYAAGQAVGAGTYYIYDETGTTPNCSDEVSFTVTINITPDVFALADVEACDSFVLPAINGNNLSGNQAYYDGPGGTGTQYSPMDVIATSGTYYIYDETGTTPNCFDQESFVITITPSPTVDAGSDEEICEGATLDLAASGTTPIASNTSSLSWTTAGDGSFDDPTALLPVYTPGVSDIANGSVVLTLTGNGNGSCPLVFDAMTLTITPAPIVDAGSDEEICEGATLDLAASGTTPIDSNTSSLSWATAGDGSFDDDTALMPVYTPGINDIANGSVVLTLTGNGNGSCPATLDAMTLTITPAPIVDAGSDEEVCQGATLDLAASGTTPIASNTSSLSWTTAGDGSFDDPTALLPVYTPGVSDIANGSVVLTLTGNGNGSCPATLDAMTLTITPAPIVDAGSDEEVCQGATLDLAASGTTPIASNTSSLTWATAGDGSFDDATALLPVYTPGANDIANGLVVLTLTGNGNGSCPAMLDSMTLTITPLPIADAPTDVESCDSYVLPALANGNYFDAPNGGGNAYAANDVITATTTLYVFSPGTGSCPDVENSFTVTINNTPAIDPLADQTACDAYTLPAITGSNLSGNEAYFTGTGGTGTQYAANDVITATTTLYVFSPGTGSCPDVEESFDVIITGFSLTTNVQNETCWESNNGAVSIEIGDADFPVAVQLNSMESFVFNTNSFLIDNLAPGDYDMSVIDNSGCQISTSFEIESGGPNLGASVDVMYLCDANLPSNAITVTLFDPSINNDILYALDSTEPNDFVLSPDFGNISPGNHSLFIMHNNGCLSEIPFVVESFEQLDLTLTSEYVNQITANVIGGTGPYTYYFDDNNGTSSNTFNIDRSGTFTVRVVDSNGCEVIESITMNLVDIKIPDFFTPNYDGQNDTWAPRNAELFPDIETYIFDRYGRKIQILGPSNDWDGEYDSKPMPSGDYWYIVKLNDGSGREFVGHFTLYR
ncbi:T9SS type B sorting domain-containing protein [Flagellimonas sp.]|uniref:T9SS type B sorting domain-containing protein n=1 Tax=Flagellimonas sp. TaxID=2058762 RepID=UPI003BAAD87D